MENKRMKVSEFMKMVLAQDWITDNGGGEKCLRAFLDMYPKSPIYTLIWNEKKVVQFDDTKIVVSFLQKYPRAKKNWQLYFPFMPRAVESLSIPRSCDVVIANCYSAIKGLITKPGTLFICYCHTPTRYLWLPELDRRLSGGNIIKRMVTSRLIHRMRIWDFDAAQRPDLLVANSRNIARRIKKFYRRDAHVIYPPVDFHGFKIAPKEKIGEYFLFVSRLVPYKKADLVVETFNKLGLPLKIVGDGPERKKIESKAGKNVEILGYVNDRELKSLLSRCRAFIFPAEEDFGIAPVEAMASGRPIIAYGKGGALETVVEGRTGIFFKKQTVESLSRGVEKFIELESTFDPNATREWAEKFSVENYKQNWKKFIEKSLAEFREGGRIS